MKKVRQKQPIQTCYRLFGAKIQQIRETLGITQQELANKVGLTRTSIVNIENGNQRVLLHDVERFSAAFNLSPRNLLRGMWT